MKKKYSRVIVGAVAALAFIGTFVFLYQKSRPQPVAYTELKATVGDIRKTTIITGKIEPRDEVSVKPQISGIVSEIMKEPGPTCSTRCWPSSSATTCAWPAST